MRRARRALLWTGTALGLGYAAIVAAVSLASEPDWQVSLPAWSGWLGLSALAAGLGGLLLASLSLRGGALTAALLSLPLLGMLGFLALMVSEFLGQSGEIGRVAVPNGRVAVLTLEPVPTDFMYALWWADGIGLRPMLRPVEHLTHSKDGRFTRDPALVLAPDGRRLLIRRGGIWTDCIEIDGPPRDCPIPDDRYPVRREDFLARSERIAALTGLLP